MASLFSHARLSSSSFLAKLQQTNTKNENKSTYYTLSFFFKYQFIREACAASFAIEMESP